MRRWGYGQGKHLTGTEQDEIHRRIVAGESFGKVAAVIGCSTKSIQRLLDDRSTCKRKARVRSPRRLSCADREELSRGLVLGQSFRRVAEVLGRARLVPELRRPKSAEFPMVGVPSAALAAAWKGVEGTREQDQD